MRSAVGPWLCLLTLAVCCSSETPGRSVPVKWQLDQNLAGDEADFDTDTGYQVHVDEARLALGAVYAYSAAPSSVSALAQLERWFVPVAHAHGGLDAESGRKVLAELTQLTVVDTLAAEPWTSAMTTAEAGTIDAIQLEYAQSAPSELQGGQVFVRGQAERAGERRRFEAVVSLGLDVKARSVDLTGLGMALDTNAVLRIAVHPREWFRLCEFAELPPTAADEVVQVTVDTQVGRALVVGVRSPDAFDFRTDNNE